MKRALTILVLAAVPVFADEPAKKTETQTARPQTISSAPASPADSPLVAAARRSNRGKKSTHKITNANIGKYGKGAHITTTTNQEPIVMPAPLPPSQPTADMKHAAQRDKERKVAQALAEKKKKEDAARLAKLAATAERLEEGMYGDTDADVDYGDGQQQEQPLPKVEPKKPPQG
jgi:hypothetical protein